MPADAFLVESKQTPLHLFLTTLDSSVTFPQQSSLCSLAAFNLQLQIEFTKCQLIGPVKGHFVQALDSAVFRICNKP